MNRIFGFADPEGLRDVVKSFPSETVEDGFPFRRQLGEDASVRREDIGVRHLRERGFVQVELDVLLVVAGELGTTFVRDAQADFIFCCRRTFFGDENDRHHVGTEDHRADEFHVHDFEDGPFAAGREKLAEFPVVIIVAK